ncbi:MAG: class I SAM-dependent methyltransferase [Natronomonas sp.]
MQTIDFDRLGVDPGDRVIDVGCGEGRHCHGAVLYAEETGASVTDEVNVVGIDIDGSRLQSARSDYEEHVSEYVENTPPPVFCRGDATSIPVSNSSVDVVVCSEVLEHLPDFGSALDEISRVLKPDGRLAVSVPRYGPERVCWALSSSYHEVEGGHVRIFRRRELHEAIESRGYRCIDSHYAHALHAPYWWLKCLWWDLNDQPGVLSKYEQFLERMILEDAPVATAVERVLNPVLGKSLVLYFDPDPEAR